MFTEIDADQSAVAEIQDREPAGRDVAERDRIVVMLRQADDLQLHLVLVGPEPRHRRVGLGVAHDRVGDGLALVDGVLHGFEPHQPLRHRMRKRRAVADGVDVGIGGAQMRVDHDAAVARKSRRLRQIVIRR